MSARAYLVDDDEAIRDSLGWLLESRGVACESYPSAEDFLAAWSRHSPVACCSTSAWTA
jgi:two-component system response regulator DctR